MEKKSYLKPETTRFDLQISSIIAGSKGGSGTDSGVVSQNCGWNDAEGAFILDPYDKGKDHLYSALEVYRYLNTLSSKTDTFCADGNDTINCNSTTLYIDKGYNYSLKAEHADYTTLADGSKDTTNVYFTVTGLGTSCGRK